METELSPYAWASGAWKSSRLELFIPAALGLTFAQFVTALFVLRSYNKILAGMCLIAVVYGTVQALSFLFTLSKNSTLGVETRIDGAGFRRLFAPLLLGLALYALLSPSPQLALFFVLMSVPHFFFLLYLMTRYATLSVRAETLFALPSTATLLLQTSLLARAFRKIPDFRRP